MKVLKERTGPPFKTDPDTLRLEYANYLEDFRSLFRGRMVLHATALTFFLTSLTAYGLLLSTGAQHAGKLPARGREMFENLAIILPVGAMLAHVVFFVTHASLHYMIAERSLRCDVLRSLLCSDMQPYSMTLEDQNPSMTESEVYSRELRERYNAQWRMPPEHFAGILHAFAVLVWAYLVYQVL